MRQMIRHVTITSLTAAIHNNSAPCEFNVRCSSENMSDFKTSCETVSRYPRVPSQSWLTVKTYAVSCTLLIKPTAQTPNAINSIRHDALSLAMSFMPRTLAEAQDHAPNTPINMLQDCTPILPSRSNLACLTISLSIHDPFRVSRRSFALLARLVERTREKPL
jgi:hypothetical protein